MFPNQPPLNWTPVERLKNVSQSSHQLNLTTTNNLSPQMLDEIQWRLSNFVDFNGGHNQVALVYTSWEGGVRYAWFDMRGPASTLSRLVNGSMVPVRLWCEQALRQVVADTAGRHMLIGQRRWSFHAIAANSVTITTEAHERPRGRLNQVGMFLLGKAKQYEVWLAYFENLRRQLKLAFDATGTIVGYGPNTVNGNPWDPKTPYPARGGNC